MKDIDQLRPNSNVNNSGFLTAIYFYFVSISTVGLGDVVFHNVDYMILNFILILVGLALLSMCFNLIQVVYCKVYKLKYQIYDFRSTTHFALAVIIFSDLFSNAHSSFLFSRVASFASSLFHSQLIKSPS